MEKPLENLVGGYSNTAIFRTMAFIGDSLSSGEFESMDPEGNRGYHDMYEYSFGQFIARRNGIKAYNFSVGGMTARGFLEFYAEPNGLFEKDKACQAYVIALGYNDIYNQKLPIGSSKDIEATEFDGVRPYISYYAAIVRKYKEISPDAKFFFVTFTDESGKDKDVKEAMVKAMYDLADHFDNSYVIDLYHNAPAFDDDFKEKYFLYRHMSPAGYMYFAELVDSYIDYIIRTNPEDFKKVGFIGKNIL